MKFSSPAGKVDSEEVKQDFESAARYEKLRVGKLGVYFPEGFGTKYIPYSYMEQAFIRIQEVNGNLCCGNATFAYYRLVFVHSGKEFADYMSENEKKMDEALAAIADECSTVKIGIDP